jgi:hypothetical protein
MSVSKCIIECIHLVDSQWAPSVLSYLEMVNYYKPKPGEATEPNMLLSKAPTADLLERLAARSSLRDAIKHYVGSGERRSGERPADRRLTTNGDC